MARLAVTVQYYFEEDDLVENDWNEAEMRENYPDRFRDVKPGLLNTAAAEIKTMIGNHDFVNEMEFLSDCSDAKLISVRIEQ